jgi:hypothetical protein
MYTMLKTGLYRETKEPKKETKQPIREQSAVTESHVIGEGTRTKDEGNVPRNRYKATKRGNKV